MPSPLESIGSTAARGTWLARGAWMLALAEALIAVKKHFDTRLTERDRARLVEIVKTSKGRPANLSNRERRELKDLFDKVEPKELAKTIATSGLGRKTAGGIRRR